MEPANLSTHLTKRVADHASLPSRPNPRPNTPPAQLDPTNGSANPPMRRPDRLIRPRYCGERLGPTTTRLHHTDSPGGSAAQRTRGYLVDDSERHEAAESRGQPDTKAPTTRTSSHTTTRSNGRAGRCTRYGTMHPIRGTAPDQKRCIAYGSGATPQHTRINAALANRATPPPQPAQAQDARRAPGGCWAALLRPRPTRCPNTQRTPASSHGDRGRGRGWLGRRARRAYSLTPPAVRPETMYFCRYWNSRMTGTAARTAPAAKMPHGAVRSSAAHMYIPTASVN